MIFFLILFFVQQIFSSDLTVILDDKEISTPTFVFEPQKYDIPSNINGEELFNYLHKITEQKYILSYSEAKKKMFYEVDNTFCPNEKEGVWAFYSNMCIEGKYDDGSKYKENVDINGDGYIDSKGMNTEHIWPQSFFSSNYPMVSDLNHLRPTFITPNNKRANLPLCYVTDPIYYIKSSNAKLDGKCFEPPDRVKGDVARVLFYFVLRYYDRKITNKMDFENFFTSKVKDYIIWNRIDPPDENEIKRNDLVYKYQGNRNPFIDNPNLIDRISVDVWEKIRPN